MARATVNGYVDSRFASVRDVFRENFARGELGAGLRRPLDGQVVVDVWGGWADDARTQAVDGGHDRQRLLGRKATGRPRGAAARRLRRSRAGRARTTRGGPSFVAGQQGATVRAGAVPSVPAYPRCVASSRTVTSGSGTRWPGPSPTPSPGGRPGRGTPTTRTRTASWSASWLAGSRARSGNMAPGAHRYTARRRCRVGRAQERPPSVCRRGVARTRCRRRATSSGRPCTSQPGRGGDDRSRLLQSARDLRRRGGEHRSMAVRRGALDEPPRAPQKALPVCTRRWRPAGPSKETVVLDADVLAEAVSVQSEGWCPVLEREVSFGLGFQPTRPDRSFGPNPGSFGHFGTGAGSRLRGSRRATRLRVRHERSTAALAERAESSIGGRGVRQPLTSAPIPGDRGTERGATV